MVAPMDFNLLLADDHLITEKVLMAQKLGYECVAINNVVEGLCDKGGGGKNKDKKVKVLSPEEIKVSDEILKHSSEAGVQPVRQLSRISTVLTDHAQTHTLNTPVVQSYDLVAVQPMTEKTFQQACTTLEVDIIMIDVSQKLGFNFKRSTVHKAIERGIHFELQYSPAIRDKSLRKYLINTAKNLVLSCKGKNLIVTSGCEKAFEMRGPHDVANLGLLFDLNEAQAKDVLARNCRAVLYHSEARRLVKSAMSVECVSDVSSKDQWLLKQLAVENSQKNGSVEQDFRDDSLLEDTDGYEPVTKKTKTNVENT